MKQPVIRILDTKGEGGKTDTSDGLSEDYSSNAGSTIHNTTNQVQVVFKQPHSLAHDKGITIAKQARLVLSSLTTKSGSTVSHHQCQIESL